MSDRASSTDTPPADADTRTKTESAQQALDAAASSDRAPSAFADSTGAPVRAKTIEDAHVYLANRGSGDADGQAPIFGSRLLNEESSEDAIWEHNAWDHVQPPGDYIEEVQAKLEQQKLHRVSQEDALEFHRDAASHWDVFYSAHREHFFKNRKWLAIEFPILQEALRPEAGPKTIVEVGCGAGDTLLPLWRDNQNPELRLFGFDYSAEAIKVVKASEDYNAQRPGTCCADVWDLSAQSEDEGSEAALPPGVAAGTVDAVVLIFVLSALRPQEWAAAARNVHAMLKPGGQVLLRDYGRHDLPQIRFKKNRLLEDNFYVRGDGTRVYFFEKDEILSIFSAAGSDSAGQVASPLFRVDQLIEDRRLLVNRREKKRMYRVWLQGKLIKL